MGSWHQSQFALTSAVSQVQGLWRSNWALSNETVWSEGNFLYTSPASRYLWAFRKQKNARHLLPQKKHSPIWWLPKRCCPDCHGRWRPPAARSSVINDIILSLMIPLSIFTVNKSQIMLIVPAWSYMCVSVAHGVQLSVSLWPYYTTCVLMSRTMDWNKPVSCRERHSLWWRFLSRTRGQISPPSLTLIPSGLLSWSSWWTVGKENTCSYNLTIISRRLRSLGKYIPYSWRWHMCSCWTCCAPGWLCCW